MMVGVKTDVSSSPARTVNENLCSAGDDEVGPPSPVFVSLFVPEDDDVSVALATLGAADVTGWVDGKEDGIEVDGILVGIPDNDGSVEDGEDDGGDDNDGTGVCVGSTVLLETTGAVDTSPSVALLPPGSIVVVFVIFVGADDVVVG